MPGCGGDSATVWRSTSARPICSTSSTSRAPRVCRLLSGAATGRRGRSKPRSTSDSRGRQSVSYRKLLDWKSLFIYVHRWMGIMFGVVFVVWFVSGIAMMYVRMPELSVAERLGHSAPLDFSAATVTPAEALRSNGLKSARVGLEMDFNGR